MEATDGSTITTTDYSANLIYKTIGSGASVLEFVSTPEGKVIPDLDMWEINYYLKDHLGNNRVVFGENPDTLGKAILLQESHYYPFGQEFGGDFLRGTDRFKYNGKEMQEDLGLHWYDYGARFYDVQLGRFHSSDPLAEEYSFQSPFVYAANNPVRFIDWMGMNADVYITGSDTDHATEELNKVLTDLIEWIGSSAENSTDRADMLRSTEVNGAVMHNSITFHRWLIFL